MRHISKFYNPVNKLAKNWWCKLFPWLRQKRRTLFLIGGCSLLSFGFLLITSKSSPLYPINDWVDPQTFFTMGKGMMNGLAPYRDLFEHKGPLLYLIYGIGYIINNTNFLGVFLLEVLFFAIFLFFSYKTLRLYVDPQFSVLALVIFTPLILNMRSFAHGGSAEQFSLTFIMISLFYLIRYAKEIFPNNMPLNWVLINGVVAGCIFWIKYSYMGFWVGWIATILLLLFSQKKYKDILITSLLFITGFLIATIPWVLYFYYHQAINEWLHTYFVINLTAYPQNFSLREIIWITRNEIQRHSGFNPIATSILLIGLLTFLTHRRFLKNLIFRLGLVFSFGCLVLGVYIGGRNFIYYFFIFSPFIILGLIALAQLFHDEYHKYYNKIHFVMIIILILIGSFYYTLRYHRNTYMLNWKKEELVQFRFAEIINQTENPTLLNYGFADGGFYTTAGITPSTRFFQSYNIEYSEFSLILDEQNRYIIDRETDFLVMRFSQDVDLNNIQIPGLYENYRLIDQYSQPFGDTEFTYLLFALEIH